MDDLPISTKWTLDAAGATGRIAVDSVYLISATSTDSKGTGFLLSNGYIITNEHVVRNNPTPKIIAISPTGKTITFSNSIIDAKRDLAILVPTEKLGGGLSLGDDSTLNVGSMVTTWGFPLGYNGPAPLLSVGYLAGFKDYRNGSDIIKHLVVNGAFNPGNSGGPLFLSGDNKVIGIVVSKHAPISQFHKSALDVLAKNASGVAFDATNEKGEKVTFVESQLVAGLLNYFRDLTQVMIGEAISVSDLKDLLKENSISTV
jgi:S1-C subfamily serine protease